MNGDTTLILKRLGEHNDKIQEKLGEHGEALARIDERTKNQNARLNRLDRRSGALGAVSGALSAAAVVVVKSLGFGDG